MLCEIEGREKLMDREGLISTVLNARITLIKCRYHFYPLKEILGLKSVI